MAKRKPVDEAAVQRSTSAVLGYAERMGVDEPAPVERTNAREGLFSHSVMPESSYVPSSLGARLPDAEDAPSARWKGYHLGNYLTDLAANETIAFSVAVALREAGRSHDPSYRLPAAKSEDWKQLTSGIAPEQWHVLGSAMSAEHAREIAFRLREEKQREMRLMESGVLPFLVGNILNPESVLMAIGTGGISWVQKGSRLTRAMKAAGLAATENVAQEAALFSLQDSRDEMDMAYAAMAGIVLGGAFGALGKGLPDDYRKKMADAARADADRVATAQAESLHLIPPQPRESAAQALFASETKLIEGDIARHLDAEEARLQKIADGPDAAAVRLRNDFAETQARLDRAKAMRDEIARELSENESKQIDDEAVRLSRADEKNDYAIKRARESGSPDDAVFPQWKELAAVTVTARRARASKDLTDAQKVVEALQLDVNRVNRVRAAESDLEQVRFARKKNTLDERIESLPEMLKGSMQRRLAGARKDLEEGLALEAAPTMGATAPETGSPATGFADDSAGAASLADTLGVDQGNLAEPARETAPTWVAKFFPRMDYGWRLRHPKLSPEVRARTETYVGDPMPSKGDVSVIGASEEALRLRNAHGNMYAEVYEPAFQEWAQESGKSVRRRTSRREFGALVTKELRGESTGSAAAKRAASRLADVFGQIGDKLKDAEVKGFEDFTRDARYLPRVIDRMRALASRDTYGEPAIVKHVAAAMKKTYDEMGLPLDGKLLKAMSEGYYARIHDLSLGIQNDALQGLRLADADQVAGLLRLGGVADEEVIADVTMRLRNALNDPEKGGSARFAKHRTSLDEDHQMRIWNKDTSAWENKSLRDLLFTDDADQLFQTYNHVMSGWVALARQAGIKSKTMHTNLVDAVKRELGKEGEKVAGALDDAFKFIVGQPLQPPNWWTKGLRRIGRTARDWQFTRVMNMVAFAQVPDAAAFLTPHYFRYIARHFPEMSQMFKRAQDGTLDHKLAQELVTHLGSAADTMQNRLFSAFDDEPHLFQSKLEHGVRVAAQVTERNPLGVSKITTVIQRLTEIGISQRYVDNILGKSKNIDADHWRGVGLDDEMIAKIKKQIEASAEFDGSKLVALNLDQWKDGIARDKFCQAVHRKSSQLAQREDFGDTMPFMHTAWGKMLIQFRRFGLVSWVKQMGNFVAQPSMEGGARLVLQWGLGSMSYMAQMYMYSLTKPEEEQQEWREKYLTPTRIMFAGIARAGMFSLTPMIGETVWQSVTGTEGAFANTRSSGLAGNMLAGVPVLDFVTHLGGAMSGAWQAAVREDRQFDRKDFDHLRKVLLFQNMIGIKQALDWIGNSLPANDEDDDNSVANFLGGVEIRQGN